MSATPGDALLARLLGFGRTLRRLGLDVHTGRMLDVVDALSHVELARRDDVFHVCRALLVHRHEDLETFERAFDAFWTTSAAVGVGSPDADSAPDGGPPAAGRESMGLLETQTGDAAAENDGDELDVPA